MKGNTEEKTRYVEKRQTNGVPKEERRAKDKLFQILE